jgi:peptide/nickel transport system substrate-binding protein
VEAPQEAAEPAEDTAAPQEEAVVEVNTAPQEEAAAPAVAGEYKEAPMLAELVAAGELPPVAERLPTNPRVITPLEEVGQYGGTWRRAYKGVSDRWGPTKLHEEMAIEWDVPDPDTVNVTAGFVEEWTQNDDATEFTFKLREGIRWSDGEIFDTEDVQFWYDQYYVGGLQTQQAYYTLNGTPMEMEVLDQYTWKVRFATPNPLLPITIAKSGGGPSGGPTMAAPQHYLSQFIPDLGGDEAMINALVEEKGLGAWQELFGQAGDTQGPIAFWFLNPDLPVINAWKIEQPAPADPMVMVRNPYFYQVDTEGNQLPYIDRITHDFFDSDEVFNLWIAEGRIDMQMRHVAAANFTYYKENEAAGDYRVVLWKAASTNALYPNINHSDPVLAELFDNPQFREALSIAINREEINELAYNGLLEPRQASPISGSPNYDLEFETRWAEYDPERANALLDELGLERGADGIRMRSDGQPLVVSILHREQTGTPGADEMNLVAQYWGEIGLQVNQDVVERSLYEERVGNGEVDIGVWGCDRNSVVMADPGRYLGTIDDGPWAPLFGHWYVQGPEKQLEPPEDHIIREIWSLWEQARVEPDETKRNGIFQELLNIHKEHPWMIGTVGESPALAIVSNKFRNFGEGFIADDTLRDSGSINPQQFWIQQA